MKIMFVDEGESNRALIAMSLYSHMSKSLKKKKLPKAYAVTTKKNKSLHMKGLKSLKEFGLCVSPCSRKDVIELESANVSDKTRVVVLGQDNDKDIIKKYVKKKNIEYWAIDSPIMECKNDVKLRFFRRTRDQLWVQLENLVESIKK